MDRTDKARQSTMVLVVTDDGQMLMKSRGGNAHVLDVDGRGTATACTCPDWVHRNPDDGCYHMRAYNDWDLLDRVSLSGELKCSV